MEIAQLFFYIGAIEGEAVEPGGVHLKALLAVDLAEGLLAGDRPLCAILGSAIGWRAMGQIPEHSSPTRSLSPVRSTMEDCELEVADDVVDIAIARQGVGLGE